MPKIRIDEVYSKNSAYPLLITFQNGYTTEDFQANNCKLFSNEKEGVKCVAAEINDMLYAGDEDKEQLGKTVILARNKTTGKVRLIELGHAQLKPILKIENEAADSLDTSYLELSRKFGSKKQKQIVEQREKFKLNKETINNQVETVTQSITKEKLDLSAYNTNDSDNFYIPPIDRNADKPENVYDIEKILSEDDIEKISAELEGKEYSSDFLPFFKELTSQKKLSQRHTALAVYANYLLKFYLVTVKDICQKKFLACPHSVTLNEIIFNNFTVFTNKRTRPTQYKDKTLCYVMVIALLLNGLKFKLESLSTDVKLSVNTLALKAKVIGASVVTIGSQKYAQLKLPLSIPGSVFRRKSAKF